MKKYIYILCSLLLWTPVLAQPLAQAEKAYEQGDFAAAKTQYAPLAAAAPGATTWQAQLRLVACEYSLGEFLQAAKTLLNYPLPEDALWQARFLLYRTHVARQVSRTYSRALNTTQIASPQAAADPAQWTPQQWQEQIDRDYRHLWQLRAALIQAPIEQEKLILNLSDTDTRRIATLFDFAANSWKEYLQENDTLSVRPLSGSVPHYLEGTARLKQGSHKDTTLLISQIREAAALLEGKNRQNARLFWQTDAILQPLADDFFVLEKPEVAFQQATKQLQQLTGQNPAAVSWWKRLKNRVTANAASDYGRSYAAWQLAQQYAQHHQFEQALQTCAYAQQLTPSYYTQSCQDLTADITRVDLHADASSAPINRHQPQLAFSGKNLSQVYVRLYPVSFEELTQMYRARSRHNTLNAWQSVTHLDDKSLLAFLSRTPVHTKKIIVAPKGVGQKQSETFDLPALEPGFYVVLMSTDETWDAQRANVYGWVINATDLAVLASAAIEGNPADYVATRTAAPKTHKPNVFHLYTVNLETGKPQPDTRLQLITDWNGTSQSASTDKLGQWDAPRQVVVSAKEKDNNANYTLDVLAQKDASTAYTANRLYFHFYNEPPVKLFAQTDLPIYRPGQHVQLAVQALERLPRGFKTLDKLNVRLEVTDPNGKRIFTASPRLNAWGSAQAELALPQNTLLGHYQVTAALTANGRTYHTYHSFKIEEYKRPDYELTLAQPEKALEYGKRTVLSGNARYYMGTSLEKATVNYTIKRRNYLPPFYWWWRRPQPQEKVVLQGQTVTDDKGSFKIAFTPVRQEEDEEFANYLVEANVYDESGRTVTANRTYKISAHAHLVRVNFTQGFYDARQPAALAEIDLTDADGNSTRGKITATVARLENRLPDSPADNYPKTDAPLDTLYRDFAADKPVLTRTLSFTTPGAQTLQIPALPEGVYRLELRGDSSATQQMVFVVAEEKSALLLPDMALAQHSSYYPGETMRVLVGSNQLPGTTFVEVYQADKFLTHRAQLSGGVQVFSLPLTQNHRGGVALRWFGAGNYVFHQGQTHVQVPFDPKRLQVNVNVPPTAKPGEKTHWNVSVKEATGSAVNGILNVTVYDKSLDYYIKNHPPFTFEDLYPQRTATPDTVSSNQGPALSAYYAPRKPAADENRLDLLPFPSLNLQMPWRAYARRSKGGLMTAGAMPLMMASAVTRDTAANFSAQAVRSAALPQTEEMALDEKADDNGSSAAEEPQADLRTDFSPTAYFNPSLPFTAGKATLNFTLPQSLTAWNLFGFALTSQAHFGGFEASFITRKDVMLRLQLPRFYREGDRGVIQAALTNQTAKKVTARVSLNVGNGQTSALKQFGVLEPEKTVTLAPQSTQFVTWEITAPAAPDLYQITAVARYGTTSDGEQKTLPVLPGKMRLLAGAHVALKNGTNTLTLPELAEVPQQEVELAALALHPSLALSVLNTMPNLLSSPYKDLVSSLNRYMPLAVVHQFYTTYPQLKEAVQKLPKRTGLTPPWNEKDPLRLQLLEQTPWLRQAQGRQVRQAELISLFDDKAVAQLLQKEQAAIRRYQNKSGAFSWFAGGPDDDYLTLYALHAFSEALAYKAPVEQEVAQKALTYLVPRIETRLKQDASGSAGTVSYALYAAYTLSAFPATWKQVAQAKPYIKRWADYADEHAKFMTPLGQIYAAAVYHRLGDDTKANTYLDLVLSRMKEDPLTGAYFAPEAQSWLWYNDTLTTQTVTLRTLLELRPGSDKIDSLTQWLLFNRQANDWTDSKAAAQAVFTLLDVMQAKGALSEPSFYQIDWSGETKELTFNPFDWTEDLQFVRTGEQLTPAVRTATVTKQGPQTDFASLSAVYRAADTAASPKGVINVTRAYFLRVKQGTETQLLPLDNDTELHVGDEVEVHLTLDTDSAFEYVFLQDPKPAGFESADLLSGWAYQNVSFYREVKDAATHFFISWLPRGTVTLRYLLRPSVAGKLHALPAQVQSMYAPQFGAHSQSRTFNVAR